MPTPSNEDQSLADKVDRVDEKLDRLADKFDRLMIGSNGSEGALGRISEVEHRQGFMTYCYLWIVAGMVALFWMVVPTYFQTPSK
jgi:hypothetical protein